MFSQPRSDQTKISYSPVSPKYIVPFSLSGVIMITEVWYRMWLVLGVPTDLVALLCISRLAYSRSADCMRDSVTCRDVTLRDSQVRRVMCSRALYSVTADGKLTGQKRPNDIKNCEKKVSS